MSKTEVTRLRETPEEKARTKRVAKVADDSVSEFLRRTIDRLAKRHGVYDEPEGEK